MPRVREPGIRSSRSSSFSAFFLSLFASFASGACVSAEQRGSIDCSLQHTDTRIEQCSVVRRASEFGECLSADEIDAHSCVIMDSDLSFCADQPPMPISTYFNESDKTLDCAGGSMHFGASADTSIPFVRFRDDESLSDINVRNCSLLGQDWVVGVQMIRFFSGELGGNGRLDEGEPMPLGHHDVLIEDVTIQDGGVGIYLGNFSRDVTIRRTRIDGTKRIAIYSEAGSHRVQIADSIISGNQTREAVAMDSTYDSEIRNTLFLDNREGDINLYQNCGELKGTVCPVVRSTPPNNNRIIGNAFVNSGVAGVQVASRQGRRHSLGWCSSLNGLPGNFTDTAEGNVIADNTFVCDEGTSMVLMDGPNRVEGNRVVARDRCVPYEISTGGLSVEKGALLDGLLLKGNRIDATRPPRLRYRNADVIIRQ